MPIALNSPACQSVRDLCMDHPALFHAENRTKIDVLWHLRKCDDCRDILPVEDYMHAVNVLLLSH